MSALDFYRFSFPTNNLLEHHHDSPLVYLREHWEQYLEVLWRWRQPVSHLHLLIPGRRKQRRYN